MFVNTERGVRKLDLLNDIAEVIMKRPQIFFTLFMVIVAALSFLFGRRTVAAEMAKVQERLDALSKVNQANHHRLTLASEKGGHIAERLEEIEIEIANLKFRISEIADEVPAETMELLAAAADSIGSSTRDVVAANVEVRDALSETDPA